MYQRIMQGTLIESIPYIGIEDYKILKHQNHHLFQSHPLKYHEEHPKAQQLLLLSMARVKSTSIIELLPFFSLAKYNVNHNL